MVTLEDVVEAVLKLDQKFDHRFDSVDSRFDGIDGRLDGIEGRLDGIDLKLVIVDGRLDGIDGRFDGIDTSLRAMQRQGKKLEVRFNKFERHFIKHEAYTEGLDTILAKLESNTRVTATVVSEHGRDIAELKASLGH